MGQSLWGRPVLEKGTPVNEGNQPLRDNGEGLAFGLPLTLCVSRMDETLSRKENGAVNVGNIDLILPVRVRTRTEDVGRTPGPMRLWRDVASAPRGVSKRPVNVTPKGGALA